MAAEADAVAWIVTLPGDDRDLAAAREHLSADELTRADRFRAHADRTAYVYAHAALRILLEPCAGPLGRAAFDRRPQGKPYIAGNAIGFSFSRAPGKAVVGIITNGEIGVDIEPLAADKANADLVASFSEAERRWIEDGIDEAECRRRFYRLWVIREALVKATGEGLSRPIAGIALEFEAGTPILPAESAWKVQEAPPAATYAAAAVVPRNRTLTWRDTAWSALAR